MYDMRSAGKYKTLSTTASIASKNPATDSSTFGRGSFGRRYGISSGDSWETREEDSCSSGTGGMLKKKGFFSSISRLIWLGIPYIS